MHGGSFPLRTAVNWCTSWASDWRIHKQGLAVVVACEPGKITQEALGEVQQIH